MSNRYVWSQYGYSYEPQETGPGNPGLSGTSGSPYYVYTANDSDGLFTNWLGPIGGIRDRCDWTRYDRKYVLNRGDKTDGIPAGTYFGVTTSSWDPPCYVWSYRATAQVVLEHDQRNDFVMASGSCNKIEGVPTQGSLIGTVSNSGASTYPPRDYPSKSARIWPYSAPGMRGSGRVSTSMYPLLGAALTI